MKRSKKRLFLDRETLRLLAHSDLQRAAGGLPKTAGNAGGCASWPTDEIGDCGSCPSQFCSDPVVTLCVC